MYAIDRETFERVTAHLPDFTKHVHDVVRERLGQKGAAEFTPDK